MTKIHAVIFFGAIAIGGCASKVPKLDIPDGSNRVPVNRGLVAGSVVGGSVAASVPTAKKVLTKPSIQINKFELLPTDFTVRAALVRWATDEGFKIVWDMPEGFNPSIDTYSSIDATDMRDAIGVMVERFRNSGQAARAFVYQDKVIRLATE